MGRLHRSTLRTLCMYDSLSTGVHCVWCENHAMYVQLTQTHMMPEIGLIYILTRHTDEAGVHCVWCENHAMYV